MGSGAEIGQRVRETFESSDHGLSQGRLAHQVDMAPDALSRALNGKRSFSAVELARLAEILDVDVYWLITGESDPKQALYAARHSYDFRTGQRDVPRASDNEATLSDIELAYRQAGDIPTSASLPIDVEQLRSALGDGFVRPFADRVEQRLGVDIVRVAELSTAYCFTMSQRHVVVLPAVGNWFRENWDVGHELGHLVAGDLSCSRSTKHQEVAANAFAAQLLLPEREMLDVDWAGLTEKQLAAWIWEHGVSTEALARRLDSLGLKAAVCIEQWACQPTQRLLRYHWQEPDPAVDAITRRMDEAAARRFPQWLENDHLKRIASGDLGKATLAWMLGVPEEHLDVDSPPLAQIGSDELAAALGFATRS